MIEAGDHIDQADYEAGSLLFQEGDITTFFYIIQAGQVEIFTQDKSGKKITLAIADSGQAIGEFAMVAQRPRTASARALTDVTLVKISEVGYQELLKELPEWALAMMKSLVERLIQADETIRKNSLENTRLVNTLNTILNGNFKKNA